MLTSQVAGQSLGSPKARGVTVILCCHNSSANLPRTIEHLATQVVRENVPWEVLVVDNASTDGTTSLARELWPRQSPVPFKVVQEPQLGLAHARARGIAEARYELLTFVDDDNWLCPNWIQTAYQVMWDHPEVGALGGIIEPEFETSCPTWFGPVAYLYATGPTGEPSGDVTEMHMLCGAGLTVRHSALTDVRAKGFRSVSVGRRGASLAAGEDSELTYSLRLAGWRLWIDPTLRMKHFLPERRLRWEYARRLAYWSAYATPERDALVYACKPPRHGLFLRVRELRERWFWQVGSVVGRLVRVPTGIAKRGLGAKDGDADVLRVEFLRGRLDGLLAARPWYGDRASEVRALMRRLAGPLPKKRPRLLRRASLRVEEQPRVGVGPHEH